VRYDKHHPNKPWKAEGPTRGQKRSLGYHATAVEAAVAYAKFMAIEGNVAEDGDDDSDNDELAMRDEAEEFARATLGDALITPDAALPIEAPEDAPTDALVYVPAAAPSRPFPAAAPAGPSMPPPVFAPPSSHVFQMMLSEDEALMLMRDMCGDVPDGIPATPPADVAPAMTPAKPSTALVMAPITPHEKSKAAYVGHGDQQSDSMSETTADLEGANVHDEHDDACLPVTDLLASVYQPDSAFPSAFDEWCREASGLGMEAEAPLGPRGNGAWANPQPSGDEIAARSYWL